MVRWDARAIENLCSGRERTPRVIDSDEDFALDNDLPFARRGSNSNIQEASSGHRTRMGYSPGLDSIISSDEDIQPRRRETASFDGMGLTARSVMGKRFSNDQQHLIATVPRQVASGFASDDIVSEGDSEMIQEEYASVAQVEDPPQTPIQQNLMFRRQVYEDEHDQDIIDDETDTGIVILHLQAEQMRDPADTWDASHSKQPQLLVILACSALCHPLTTAKQVPESPLMICGK
ncbi:hypothetical protein QFC21_002436 [Naganishia friedmannii]|uniref:Uncharacterized protein n=1 Tax=Naganishia friedmannii TaxID=89922 RepID=A0ACC2VX21_9TREE|nr:hypothetical protein QFC21_002436 [Naganishia friedmannii]